MSTDETERRLGARTHGPRSSSRTEFHHGRRAGTGESPPRATADAVPVVGTPGLTSCDSRGGQGSQSTFRLGAMIRIASRSSC